jgi:hypothetical protein
MTIDILWRKENAYPCTHTFLSALCNQSGYQPILFVGELSDDHKSTNTHRSSYFLCEYVHCSYTITHLHIIYRHIIPCKRYCHNMYVIYIYISTPDPYWYLLYFVWWPFQGITKDRPTFLILLIRGFLHGTAMGGIYWVASLKIMANITNLKGDIIHICVLYTITYI